MTATALDALDRIRRAFGDNEMSDREFTLFVGEQLRLVYGPDFREVN